MTNNKEFPLGFKSIHIPMSQFLISDAIPFTTMVMTMIAMWIHRRLPGCSYLEENNHKGNLRSKSDVALFSKEISTDEGMIM
mmetsp:Transcript_54530/g.65632  ORF Transcript_54530/g.65632 Transcript_54530/m.65632 type:complete len:82 (+) Transcript_54530:164-409(+)